MQPLNHDTAAREAENERLLQVALNNLKERGLIEYIGEFGDEVVTFVPFVAWLKQEGLLEGRRVVTYAGMRPYYFFLDDDQFEAKTQARQWRQRKQRRWPDNDAHASTRQRWHVYPDYRSEFRGRGRSFARPVLFIQNKFAVEWNFGPVNFLPMSALRQLFRLSADRFDIVYSRPKAAITGAAYSGDHNLFCDYPDAFAARDFANVLVLEDYCLQTGADYNTTKLEILAKTHVFVAVQGGGTHLIPYFGDSLLLVLHRRGHEVEHAYASGPYKYLAVRPPTLLVARDDEQLDKGFKVVETAEVKNGGVVIREDLKPLLDELSV